MPRFGPTLLKDLTTDLPRDFQPFETIRAIDGSGREAKATQEELLFWMHSPRKDQGGRRSGTPARP